MRQRILEGLGHVLGSAMASFLPDAVSRACLSTLYRHKAEMLWDMFFTEFWGPLKKDRSLDNMPFDLPVTNGIQFEQLAGLFASTPMDYGVIGMTIRQAAYIFGLIRQIQPQKVLEIGRYKGGSTLVIAAAMRGKGEFWSIDNGTKESRTKTKGKDREWVRTFDEQLADMCKRFGLNATLIVGDSRTIDLDTGGGGRFSLYRWRP